MSVGGYYNIDDILAEAELIPCVFNTDAIDLGYLDESSGEKDLKKNSKVDLPYWLTSVLTSRNMVKLELPRVFGPRFQVSFLADPSIVNLKDRCPYFYELGLKLQMLSQDVDLGQTLQKALAWRFKDIVIRSQTHQSSDYTAFSARLANLEARLFAVKAEGHRNRKPTRLSASKFSSSTRRKRKIGAF